MSNARFGLRVRNGLVRSITEGIAAIDPDAFAFISAAGITNATQQTAINTLVAELKTFGLWTKMKAIYPFVGGTSAAHKLNLKDPRDLDVAFRLLFFGGWTHSANGATPNGTNAYADTFLIPSTHIANNDSVSVSFYSRTQNSSVNGVQIGSNDGSRELNLFQYYAGVSLKGGACYAYPSEASTINNTNTLGLQTITRTAINNVLLIFNGVNLATNTNTRAITRPTRSLYIGASNWSTGTNQYAPHQSAFASIGDGISNTDATNLYTAVQNFQITLGRQV